MTVDISDYSVGKNYLSFGGGVNSVALMLWLIDHGIEFEAVFSNHGGDYPETYDYLDMLLDKDCPFRPKAYVPSVLSRNARQYVISINARTTTSARRLFSNNAQPRGASNAARLNSAIYIPQTCHSK